MSNLAENKLSNEKKIVTLPVSKIHVSSLLPRRDHGNKIKKSVKQMGVLQPLIVRPIPGSLGEYELIDGRGRFDSLEPDEQVMVEIVEATNSQACQICYATSQRDGLTSYAFAQLCKVWLEAIIKESGTKIGAQAQLAKEVHRTEGLISEYLSIFQLFEKLKTRAPNDAFSALKKWNYNRLVQLNRLIDYPKIVDFASELQKTPDISLEDLKGRVDQIKAIEPIELSADSLNLMQSENSGDKSIASGISSTASDSKSQQKLNKQLYKLSSEAVQSLSEVSQKLSPLMLEIGESTEKYATFNVLYTAQRVFRVLKRLQSETNLLCDRIALTSRLDKANT